MAFEDALQALLEQWADVSTRLDDESRAELDRLLGDLAGPEQSQAIAAFADFLVENLPRDHVVRLALIGGSMYARNPVDRATVVFNLRELSAADLPAEPGGSPPARADLLNQGGSSPPGWAALREVTDRLLRKPAYNALQLRELGVDPADPELIRLRRADGAFQWPMFQFRPGAAAPEADVVRRINGLLGAHEDPIGVADWWFGGNAWLGGSPYRLLGQVPDDLLIQAALAVAAEV
jgi:hypothetical protein